MTITEIINVQEQLIKEQLAWLDVHPSKPTGKEKHAYHAGMQAGMNRLRAYLSLHQHLRIT